MPELSKESEHECVAIVEEEDVICSRCREHSETEKCEICDEYFGTTCCGRGPLF